MLAAARRPWEGHTRPDEGLGPHLARPRRRVGASREVQLGDWRVRTVMIKAVRPASPGQEEVWVRGEEPRELRAPQLQGLEEGRRRRKKLVR